MTSVGYGDKIPKAIGRRIVAIIWMLFSIVFIASFTACITASLTISELRGKVRGFNDLHNKPLNKALLKLMETEKWSELRVQKEKGLFSGNPHQTVRSCSGL